jgi:hypothetical protein
MTAIKDPSEYATLPAGTRVLFGPVAAETAALKLLKDADAVGATGESASFIDSTRLIDTSKKFISDIAEGPDKEFVFLDDPSDADLQALLTSAAAKETVKIRIEFPNGRWADMIIVLSGWEMRELDKGSPMKLLVKGKQNSITRGVTVTP